MFSKFLPLVVLITANLLLPQANAQIRTEKIVVTGQVGSVFCRDQSGRGQGGVYWLCTDDAGNTFEVNEAVLNDSISNGTNVLPDLSGEFPDCEAADEVATTLHAKAAVSECRSKRERNLKKIAEKVITNFKVPCVLPGEAPELYFPRAVASCRIFVTAGINRQLPLSTRTLSGIVGGAHAVSAAICGPEVAVQAGDMSLVPVCGANP
jgi:hypothetical protein